MPDFKPTTSQEQAIRSRGSSLLIAAGAGSGKTKVLTERLLAYLSDPEHPAELDSFLIITFTRAAAGELRGRITEELSKALADDPTNRRLRRQSALCSKAQIGTIHSFCAALLRENSHLAGISPDFKILDDDRAGVMKAAALERVLDERYEQREKYPDFPLLADTAGQGRDDSRLAALVLTLHEKMQCHARPERWARQQAERMDADYADAAETVWGQEILSYAKDEIAYRKKELEKLCAEVKAEPAIAKAYLNSLSVTAEGLAEFERCLSLGWDRAYDCTEPTFPRLGVLRSSPDPALSDKVKAVKSACKDAVDDIRKLFNAPSEKLLRELKASAAPMRELLRLTLDFDRAYAAEKRRAGFLDYSDLEHCAARLLTGEDGSPTALAKSLSKRYMEIMVDEYQDVSAVQDAIFSAISDEGKNLFLVGDVKQSIYRFRLADPEIFTEKYLHYKNADEAEDGEARRVLLRENFRSRHEILDCANAVFSLCMSRRLGDIDYDENAALLCGAKYADSVPVPELTLLKLPKESDDEDSPDKTVQEARMVGAKILALKAEAGEKLSYGDIAVLLRSANSVGGVYARELAALGIPVETGRGGELFASLEVSTVLSMLSVIDEPHKDVPLIAVLRSPAFGFTADELTAIRCAKKDGDLYAALCVRAGEDEKCAAFLKTLADLRTLAPDLSANELLWQLIDRLDLMAICSAMERGRERQANLTALAELSEGFDTSGYRGLHRFVLWLERLAKKGDALSAGAVAGDAVKIMTVHKSKGLEFPVVFLCDTARRFNLSDSRDTVLVHPALGLGPKVYKAEKGIEYPSLARSAIALRTKRETLSEEIRLLYVALTRAKERLYMTAALKDPEALIEKLAPSVSVPLPPALLLAQSAPVRWLLCAALADGEKHCKIVVEEPSESENAAEELFEKLEADPEARRVLENNLAFVYPHPDAQELPSKVTATELKDRSEPDTDAESLLPAPKRSFRLPDLAAADKPLSGRERGIATHLALQYMDFARTGSLNEVKDELDRLLTKKFISAREREAVDERAIYKLFRSELGRRMKSADTLRREFKFSLLCNAKELFGRAEGEEILLQGVVDCCIVENGALTVIDYKTDRVRTEEELKERSAFYAPQLRAYVRALRRIFALEVRECVLYFLFANKAVSIEA